MTRLRAITSSLTFQVLAIAIVTRLGLFFANWFSLRVLPRLPFYDTQRPDWFLPRMPLLDGWARWDSAHYINVALNGYGLDDPEQMGQRVAFFPLYPLLVRAVATITGAEATTAGYAIAAIIAANLAFLAAVPLFAKLVARLASVEIARTATTLLLVSPSPSSSTPPTPSRSSCFSPSSRSSSPTTTNGSPPRSPSPSPRPHASSDWH